ncbi:hydrolase [Ruminococcus sp.]|uniref:hydrolase n=1 Tax=Ruminococcus sp. TaxID=41978 RepID=UPI0025F549BB|nr:hydrolase [Ruminococcus sp.]MBQ8965363.1 hydrolase [Ruminococcus sp.]
MPSIEENRDKFVEIFKANVTRPGSDKLLNYLLSENSDFFTAPASTRYHCAYEGGLCDHSLHVYYCLKDYLERNRVKDEYGLSYPDESIAVVALLHDICKVNLYRTSFRNKKNDVTGVWEKVPYYEYHDTLPYGHGEKSVYIVSSYMRLTREEAMAIRWHMGFSGEENVNTIGRALGMYPLALATHIADMEATFYIEGEEDS